MILTSVTETPSALSQVSQNGLKFTDLGAETSIGDWAPDSTSYVMISARVSGNQFTLKTPAGRYIGVDSTGGLTCERNAAGQTEIFELISREDGVSLKTFGGFLSCDSNGVVRADSDAIGSREVFRIKTQYQFLAREKTEEEDPGGENPNSLRNYLTPLMTKYQSTSTIRGNFLTPSNIKAIKKARKEDALHETLLNIREKLKSDKVCSTLHTSEFQCSYAVSSSASKRCITTHSSIPVY